jgi:hypothetical protein
VRSDPADAGHQSSLAALSLTTLGGGVRNIGTSPLYTLKTVLGATGAHPSAGAAPGADGTVGGEAAQPAAMVMGRSRRRGWLGCCCWRLWRPSSPARWGAQSMLLALPISLVMRRSCQVKIGTACRDGWSTVHIPAAELGACDRLFSPAPGQCGGDRAGGGGLGSRITTSGGWARPSA